MSVLNNIIRGTLYEKIHQLLKKYSILIVVLFIIQTGLSSLIYLVLEHFNLDSKFTFQSIYLLFDYIINSIYVIIIYKDMKKEESVNKLILILTFFSSLYGLFLFLLSITYKNIQKQKSSQDERIY
ncbi:MAG: hypothetical protein H6Q15_2012 [Bacteroidetes bacterium]|nr:hypothetical protein [Bacteroidota bacterium]